MKATISDYAEVVINFGYITLFAIALPAVGLIAFVANWLELKGDAWKLLSVFRRPIPRGAEDIGQW
jgi:anoctamin-10